MTFADLRKEFAVDKAYAGRIAKKLGIDLKMGRDGNELTPEQADKLREKFKKIVNRR